ncbi:hypothetical protein ACFWMQ_01890 [Streptomyces sp. NPDC058372]|uniref:hypothetical protein n=1 Tax=Streptomyces sp. NPDC058372 TaxID=3346464 RepID=UPI003657FD74
MLIDSRLKAVHDGRAEAGPEQRQPVDHVVPNLVALMRTMPNSVRPEAVPTMAGLVIASAAGPSPSLRRQQYGSWTKEETTPLEVTAFLVAEHINHITDAPDSATRLITDALSSAGED